MTDDEVAQDGADQRSAHWIARMVGVCLAGMAVLGLLAYGLWIALDLGNVEMSLEHVETLIRSWGMWGAVGSIVIMILHSFVPLPAEIIAMANGMVFGGFWGIVLTWTGAMLGAIISFALARWLGQPLVRRLVPARQWDALQSWEADQGAAALLVARLIPVISFNLINYAAGLAGVKWPVLPVDHGGRHPAPDHPQRAARPTAGRRPALGLGRGRPGPGRPVVRHPPLPTPGGVMARIEPQRHRGFGASGAVFPSTQTHRLSPLIPNRHSRESGNPVILFRTTTRL